MSSLRRTAATVLAMLMLAAGCGTGPSTGGQVDPGSGSPLAATVVRIAAASDLKFALEDVKTEYTKAHPNVDVQLTFGSSGNFYQQIRNGAPFDLFLSADLSFPRKLADEGLAAKEDLFPYAVGRLVVWAPNESPIDPTKGLAALRDPKAEKIAIANPEHAPYGRAAVAAMKTAGVYEAVQDRLVFGENIAQTAQLVSTGSAQVGVIALSLAVAPELAQVGRYAEVPLDTFPRLDQGGVALAKAQDPQAARAVKDFLTGPQGLEILKRYGFYLPGTGR